MRQGCPLSPVLLNTVLDALAGAVRLEKESQGAQKGSRSRLSLFADDVFYIREHRNLTRKLLEMINHFSHVAGYRINLNKPVAFLCSSRLRERGHGHTPIHSSLKEKNTARNKPNRGEGALQ